VAIKSNALPLDLEIQRHRGYPIGLIRSSYRQNGKVKHSTHGRITGLTFRAAQIVAGCLQWYLKQRLEPLFAADGTHKDREWTMRSVIERWRRSASKRLPWAP
jgi:hypothetical protein